MDSNGRLKDRVALKFPPLNTKSSERGDEQYRQSGLSSGSQSAGTKRDGKIAASGKGRGGSQTDLGEQVGRPLRDLYDDILKKPVGDRLLERLRELDAS